MFALTVAFIVIVALAFVGYPLVRPASTRPRPRPGEEVAAEIRARLAELELDRHLGHISEEEYRKLRTEYEQRLQERGKGW